MVEHPLVSPREVPQERPKLPIAWTVVMLYGLVALTILGCVAVTNGGNWLDTVMGAFVGSVGTAALAKLGGKVPPKK